MAADVIVLGGGFAGLAALDRLVRARRRVELSLSLIDRSEHSTFAPLLPDVLSGRVHTTRLRYDLARHCRRLGVRFVRAGVAAIDPQAPRVETDAGALTADYLVVCLGCDTRYPQDAALRRRAVGLKSVEDALALRERARGLVDALITDGGRGATGAVVVGGGYTGFELASHLVQTVEMSTHRSYKRWRDVCPVVVVEAAPAPLAGCSPAVRRWVVSAARRSGVRLRTGVTVSRAAGDGMLELSDGSHLRGALLAWCAGTITGPACEGLLPAGTAGRRVPVDVYLRAIGCQRVFCAGDAAAATRPGDPAPLRMAVQFSLAGGAHAAENVVRALCGQPLKRFAPPDMGYVVPLADGSGAGAVLGREFFGRLPSALHYGMCALRSWGWRNRFGVLSDLMRRGGAE